MVCADIWRSYPSRSSGCKVNSSAPRASIGRSRNARDPVRDPRLDPRAGAGDRPLWRQHRERRGARRRRHALGAGCRHRHPPPRRPAAAGSRQGRHPPYPSAHGPHPGARLLRPALSSGRRGAHLDARLSRYLSPPLFPVHLRDLPCITCHEVPRPAFEIGPFRIQTALVCHPNPTVGYRLEENGHSAVYLPDHEPALCLEGDRWLEPDWTSGHALAEGADLLIHDAQYTDAEYASCVGWGHSTYRHALEFAARVGAKEVVLFHHDPSHDDATLERLIEDARRRFKPAFHVFDGREGDVFEVGSSSACAAPDGRPRPRLCHVQSPFGCAARVVSPDAARASSSSSRWSATGVW